MNVLGYCFFFFPLLYSNQKICIFLYNVKEVLCRKRTLFLWNILRIRRAFAEGAAYAGQVKTREKFHREQKDLTGDEFVSGFARNDKLQSFITLVLYYGTKEWNGPKCLKDMLDLSEFPQGVAEMVQDYSLNLLEIRKYPYLERFQTDIRYVFGFLQNAEDKEKLIAYMRENSETFSKLDEEAYDLIAVMSKTSQLKQLKKICRNDSVK